MIGSDWSIRLHHDRSTSLQLPNMHLWLSFIGGNFIAFLFTYLLLDLWRFLITTFKAFILHSYAFDIIYIIFFYYILKQKYILKKPNYYVENLSEIEDFNSSQINLRFVLFVETFFVDYYFKFSFHQSFSFFFPPSLILLDFLLSLSLSLSLSHSLSLSIYIYIYIWVCV